MAMTSTWIIVPSPPRKGNGIPVVVGAASESRQLRDQPWQRHEPHGEIAVPPGERLPDIGGGHEVPAELHLVQPNATRPAGQTGRVEGPVVGLDAGSSRGSYPQTSAIVAPKTRAHVTICLTDVQRSAEPSTKPPPGP